MPITAIFMAIDLASGDMRQITTEWPDARPLPPVGSEISVTFSDGHGDMYEVIQHQQVLTTPRAAPHVQAQVPPLQAAQYSVVISLAPAKPGSPESMRPKVVPFQRRE